ncbi:MAG: glycosyltransferase family 2 protein [Crocinitomicaceae bacterium]|nr:glycosyltransferase family 2 protein [Crocinitomicaceae bacterium]
MTLPTVSIIIPCFNEVTFIDSLMENILAQDYPDEKIEILVADGNSSDGSFQKLMLWSEKISRLRILVNETRYAPSGLNLCIRSSTGNIIIRMDIHAIYPINYIRRLVEELLNNNAENTGGVLITEKGADTAEAEAIATVTSHPLGIGNAHFRTGVDIIRKVDTVPFGCFHREIFDRIGLYDEELLRNQDDELNGRIVLRGGTILLIPDVQVRYFARDTRAKLSAMYYQYGFFKPLVNIKLGQPASLRQFAPPSLILILGILLLLSPISYVFFLLFILVLCLYALSATVISIILSNKEKGRFLELVKTFPTVHFSYGWGYLMGLWQFVLTKGVRKKKMEELKENR